ncbi:MAG: hypothetical protein WB763_13185 [Terriglobia bacterium]
MVAASDKLQLVRFEGARVVRRVRVPDFRLTADVRMLCASSPLGSLGGEQALGRAVLSV